MMRLGGPELKLPELGSLKHALSRLRTGGSGSGTATKLAGRAKAPDVLVDLYWDLRDRHLLPVVALAVVACIAAPFLLGGSSKSEAPAPASGSASPSPIDAVEGEGHTLVVAQSEPGLREPSKRLRGLRAKDPFRSRSTPEGTQGGGGTAGTGGSASVSGGGSGESATTVATTTTPSGGGESAGGSSVSSGGGAETGSAGHSPAAKPAPQGPSGAEGGSGSGQGSGGKGSGGGSQGTGSSGHSGGIQLFTFAIDVKITKTTTKANGTKSKPEVIEKERVLPASALPAKKAQVVTYMGISPITRQPLFLVSEAVQSVFGETKCVAGEGRCQLVELEKGFPVTFVYGENNVRYKIEVLKVEPVTAGHS